MRSDPVVVGVHATQQARTIARTTMSLCLEAALGALADAGMTLDDVDAISARWPGPGGSTVDPGSADWATLLERPLRWTNDTYPAGAPALLDSAAAVAAGLCDTVLVFGGRGSVAAGTAAAALLTPANEFTAPFGSFTAAQFALVAQQYAHRFQPDREVMAGVAATIRNIGASNPAAVMYDRGPYSTTDILESPMVVTPFHRLELCLANDGAAAMVITTAERARDARRAPVKILGGASEWYRQAYVRPPRYEEIGRLGAEAVNRALGMAGIALTDVDVLELYDPNTFEVVRQLEILGYCEEGEGTSFISDNPLGVHDLAVNTDGGLLSHSHIGWSAATLKIVEAVNQLRGSCGVRQVPNAEIAVVTGAGSAAQYFNIAVLGRA